MKEEKEVLKKYRKARHICSNCFGQGRIAGRAFTDFTCECCQKECSHPDTDTPKICEKCAKEKDSCAYCLKEMD